jgi:Uma2 family endonuclease
MTTPTIFTVNMDSVGMSDAELLRFCEDNSNLRIERNEHRQILLMPPTNTFSGFYNNEICRQLANWNIKTQVGVTFDSSTGFLLPDTSMRSPDASWVTKEDWKALTSAEKNSFAPICPSFVVELRSKTDSLEYLQNKMSDVWIKNGAKLAWLIDPKNQISYIYRANGEMEIVEGFDKSLSGEDVLEGFKLDLKMLNQA